MYKKYVTVFVLVLYILVVFTGCSYIAYKDYYSNIDEYAKIWELTGFHHGYEGASPLFPKSIANLDAKQFLCRYDQQLPLGEGIQVFLEIQYTDEGVFNTELEKISSLSFDCRDSFMGTSFAAYATRLGSNFSSEYALIDEDKQVIYYIYLQNIPKSEIEFDHQFLPAGYTGFGEIIQDIK